MPMTVERYAEWKHHVATQELFDSLRSNLEMYVAKMLNRDRPDEAEDQMIRAYAKITDEILNWRPEFVSDEEYKEIEDVEN